MLEKVLLSTEPRPVQNKKKHEQWDEADAQADANSTDDLSISPLQDSVLRELQTRWGEALDSNNNQQNRQYKKCNLDHSRGDFV